MKREHRRLTGAARWGALAAMLNRRRGAVSALGVALFVLATACAPSSSSGSAKPPYCPFDGRLVLFAGDSLTGQWPQYVNYRPGGVGFNVSVGGAAYGGVYWAGDFTIGDYVRGQLDACGNNVGAVVLSGGVNDISQAQPVSAAIVGIRALDIELKNRGVKAIFLEVTPIPGTTSFFAAHQTARQQINAWMATPGNMYGTVVNCSPLMEPVPGSDVLSPKFWLPEVNGQPNVAHPNEDGYRAMAACAQPAINAALASR